MRLAIMAAIACTAVAGTALPACAGRSDTATPVPITGIAGSAQNPCWSPSGAQLVFTNFETRYNVGNAVVRAVAVTGGHPLHILSPLHNQSVNLPGQCWSRHLGLVAYSSDVPGPDEIYLVPANGGAPRRLTDRPGHLSWEPSLSPLLKHRSTWIAFESHTSGDSPGEIWKVRVDGTGLTRLTSGHDDRQPQWSPAGDRIVFQRYQPAPGTWKIVTIDPDGAHPFNVTTNPANDNTDPSWSPSGKYIVYSSDSPDIAIANLFIVKASGGARRQLTRSTGYDGAPGWSTDGTRIAFESAPYDPDTRGNTKI